MNPYRRITVKIGSNVLTRHDGLLDVTRMSALVDQVCALRNAGIEVILVTSGAVACGRSELKGLDTSELDDVSSRQLFSAVGQVKLINRYSDLFRNHGATIGQVLTTKESFSTKAHYINQHNCVEVMLSNSIVPIVNENDTVSITELMFTDNDELSGLMATMMDCDALILLSNIDGIYDGDPKDPKSKVIEQVMPDDNLDGYISSSKSSLGRGGMVSKHRIACKVAQEGIEVIIANGKKDDILLDIARLTSQASPCTRFVPSAQAATNDKGWLANSQEFTNS